MQKAKTVFNYYSYINRIMYDIPTGRSASAPLVLGHVRGDGITHREALPNVDLVIK